MLRVRSILLKSTRTVHTANILRYQKREDRQPDVKGKGTELEAMHASLTKKKRNKSELDPADISILHEILSMPVHNPSTGPIASKMQKLSPQHLSSLSLTYSDLESIRHQETEMRLNRLENNLAQPTLYNLTELIHVNALSKRVTEAQIAFDHITELGIAPDLVAYNHLMNAYASKNDLDATLRIMAEIQELFTPDLVTYSTLIKCQVNVNHVEDAFKTMQTMRTNGFKPNQIILSSLIKACRQTNQIERAWKLYTHLKTEVEQPDTVTYNLMIDICSYTKDAEKALDIFQEMASKHQPVDAYTFAGLIKVCATRDDYYGECFTLLEQMTTEGFEVSPRTLLIVMNACARFGDIEKARMVWNEVVAGGEVAPEFIQSTMYVYAKALVDYGKGKRWVKTDEAKVEIVESANSTADMEKDTIKAILDEKDMNITRNGDVDVVDTSLALAVTSNKFPTLPETEITLDVLLEDTERIWQTVQLKLNNGTLVASSALLDSYLSVLCSVHRFDYRPKAVAFYKNEYTSHDVSPSGVTFNDLIKSLVKSPTLFLSECVPVFETYIQWDKNQEAILKEMEPKPSPMERESIRDGENRGRKSFKLAFLSMARGYCRYGDLNKALDTVEYSQRFRGPFYLPTPTFKDLKNLVDAATKMADNGEWEPLKRVVKLCPKNQDLMTKVQDALGRKTLPRNWWGWDVIGTSGAERKNMMRKGMTRR